MFIYLSCVIVYKMLFLRWLFTGLTNGCCKRFYDGELPPPTCDDGVFSSVEVMVATGDFLLRWCLFFFVQAEDGIRDAQESRGLGDVYKRQPIG